MYNTSNTDVQAGVVLQYFSLAKTMTTIMRPVDRQLVGV